MPYSPLESILVVFQNPVEGRLEAYDDWYTNIHIRDAMRIEGAIATQRFVVSYDQLTLDGARVHPAHWAHTIYEWESAAKSVEGHRTRAGTPKMEISKDGSFENLRDYFYRPAFLSHGWTKEDGFRRSDDILTAMIVPAGAPAGFISWFQDVHIPAILACDGFASAGLFTLHESQSLPVPSEHPLVAIYALSDRKAALNAWEAMETEGVAGLSSFALAVEVTCWQPRIARLQSEDVIHPSPEAAASEIRARKACSDRFFTASEMAAFLLGA